MFIEDYWYKTAVIYCLDVERYLDANGDGIGDFEGLSRKLSYLAGLGVNCIWLLPFYDSPNRDNGYDVRDYYSVHETYGSLGDFVECINCAKALGMRVIVDLVVSHTSNEHRWFISARQGPSSPHHDWYNWSDTRPDDHDDGVVFPGVQKTNWTYDDVARQYYFHRFYDFQPDLNTHNPEVRDEIMKVIGFWLQLGVGGFRMDAVPFLIEKKGAEAEKKKDFEFLNQIRDFLQWRSHDAILLAEANVPPEESIDYFGESGEHLHCMLNFPVNQRLFYAFATADLEPLIEALEATKCKPHSGQWIQFLRSHDECDLGRLSEEQRQAVFDAMSPQPDMQLYGRGSRRRLAPMLGDNESRLALAYSLLFSLPGTPMLQYGDEIAMGDELSLPERECARTGMQWSDSKHGGFTMAEQTHIHVIDDECYGYRQRNVYKDNLNPKSLLNRIEHLIRARKSCPEFSWGEYTIVESTVSSVLILRYDWRDTSLITLHNFKEEDTEVEFSVGDDACKELFEIFTGKTSIASHRGKHRVDINGFGYYWFRCGQEDTTLIRSRL